MSGEMDELRQRIAAAPPPITSGLLARLRALPHVKAVRETWFYGWVQIDVDLADWNEDTWHAAHDLIDTFAREHVESFSVVGHVNAPEQLPAAVAARLGGQPEHCCEAAAAVERVRAWVASMDGLAQEYRDAAAAVRAPELVQQATNHAEDVQASADGVRRALDGEP